MTESFCNTTSQGLGEIHILLEQIKLREINQRIKRKIQRICYPRSQRKNGWQRKYCAGLIKGSYEGYICNQILVEGQVLLPGKCSLLFLAPHSDSTFFSFFFFIINGWSLQLVILLSRWLPSCRSMGVWRDFFVFFFFVILLFFLSQTGQITSCVSNCNLFY